MNVRYLIAEPCSSEFQLAWARCCRSSARLECYLIARADALARFSAYHLSNGHPAGGMPQRSMGNIVFHNTLGGQKQDFVPLLPGQVRMYTCGPTFYDFAHVGKFRTFVFLDILRR